MPRTKKETTTKKPSATKKTSAEKKAATSKKGATKADQAKAASPLAKAKKKAESNEPYVHTEKPDKTREAFEASVKKAKYKIIEDHGVPMVIVSKKNYPDAVHAIRELAEAAGYRKSWGCAPDSNKTYQGKGSDSMARYETNVVDSLSGND